jgi:hypothetical protein
MRDFLARLIGPQSVSCVRENRLPAELKRAAHTLGLG